MSPIVPPIAGAIAEVGGLAFGAAQACWVVPSIERAAPVWTAQFGVGPWLTVDNGATTDRRERGRSSTLRYRAALTQSGPIQIELIEQLSPGPSVLRDVVPEGASGLHHLATITDRYQAARATYARHGAEIAFEARFAAMRFCMIDTRATLGFMIELLEQGPDLDASMTLVRDLARGWDGTGDLIRPIERVLAGG